MNVDWKIRRLVSKVIGRTNGIYIKENNIIANGLPLYNFLEENFYFNQDIVFFVKNIILKNPKRIFIEEKIFDINLAVDLILLLYYININLLYFRIEFNNSIKNYTKKQKEIIWYDLTRRFKYYLTVIDNYNNLENFDMFSRTINKLKRIKKEDSFKFLLNLVNEETRKEILFYLFSKRNISFILKNNDLKIDLSNPYFKVDSFSNSFSNEGIGFYIMLNDNIFYSENEVDLNIKKTIYELSINFIKPEINENIFEWLNNTNIFNNYWNFLNDRDYRNIINLEDGKRIEKNLKEKIFEDGKKIDNCTSLFNYIYNVYNIENTRLNELCKNRIRNTPFVDSFSSENEKQIVLGNLDDLRTPDYMCNKKKFIIFSAIFGAKKDGIYNIFQVTNTKKDDKTNLYYTPSLNSYFLNCALYNNKAIFPIRILLNTEKENDYYSYLQEEEYVKFIGICNLTIPQKKNNYLSFYTIPVFIFYSNLSEIIFINMNGERINPYNSLFTPMRKALWNELYFLRNLQKENKINFYINKDENNNNPIKTIFVSFKTPKEIIDLSRLNNNNRFGIFLQKLISVSIKSGYPKMFEILKYPYNLTMIGGDKYEYKCFDNTIFNNELMRESWKDSIYNNYFLFMNPYFFLKPVDYTFTTGINKKKKIEKKQFDKKNNLLFIKYINEFESATDYSILLHELSALEVLELFETIKKGKIKLDKSIQIGVVNKTHFLEESLKILNFKGKVKHFYPSYEYDSDNFDIKIIENTNSFILKLFKSNKNIILPYNILKKNNIDKIKNNFDLLLIEIFPKIAKCFVRPSWEIFNELVLYSVDFIPNNLKDEGTLIIVLRYIDSIWIYKIIELIKQSFASFKIINFDIMSTLFTIVFEKFNFNKYNKEIKKKLLIIQNNIKNDKIINKYSCEECFHLMDDGKKNNNLSISNKIINELVEDKEFFTIVKLNQISKFERRNKEYKSQLEKFKKCGLTDPKNEEQRLKCFNMYFNETLEQSLLYATKYNLPIKPWFKEQGAFKTEYGLYVLSKLFSMDENYSLQLRNTDFSIPKIELKKYSSQELSLWNELSTTNDKFDNLARNIDFLDMDIWYKNNRNFRLYEKRLGEKLLKDYGIGILTKKTETTHGGKRPVSRAWLKLFEVLNEFPFKFQEKKNKDNKIKAFHICEAPGNFIKATEFFLERGKLNHDWKAQSLVESDISDEYGIVKETIEKWDFGSYQDGDITQADNIKHYYKEFKDKNIQFMTADCGVEQAESNLTLKLHFSEILTILLCLAKGGSFVSKLYFPLVDPAIIQIIYLVSTQFEKVYLYKSYQNPWNTEVYLAAIGYKKTLKPESDLATLFEYQQELEREKKNNNGDKQLLFINPKDIPEEFMRQLNYFTEKLYKIFEEAILRQFYYYDHYKELEQPKEKAMMEKAIKDANEDWINRYIKN